MSVRQKRPLRKKKKRKAAPEKKLSNKQVRKLSSDSCKDLLSKLQRAVGAARKEMPHGEKGAAFPKVLTIEIDGCQVEANTRARNFHFVANKSALVWIQTGLRKNVTEFMESRTKAISHTESTDEIPEGCHHLNYRNSVRDKVQWVPHKLAWELNFRGVPGADQQDCRKNGHSIKVDKTLGGVEFQSARKKAFEEACRLWNVLDSSKRRKIKGVGGELPFMAIRHKISSENDEEDSRCSGSEEEYVG